MSKGWAIGSAAWRSALAKDFAHKALHPGLAADEIRAMKEERWAECARRILSADGKSRDDLWNDMKSAPWKVALAAKLRRETGAPIKWIAQRLHMGTPNSVRGYLSVHAKTTKT